MCLVAASAIANVAMMPDQRNQPALKTTTAVEGYEEHVKENYLEQGTDVGICVGCGAPCKPNV